MAFEDRYRKGKDALLTDSAVCQPNRALFKEFFEYEEYKLKRRNGLPQLDEACYKTLYGYLLKFPKRERMVREQALEAAHEV